MQISIQEAYAEACRVIGEQIVERRLIVQNGAEEAAIQETKPPEERGNDDQF